MLDYSLVENLLTAAPDDFSANTVNVRSYTTDDIAEGIVKLNVGIGKPEVLAVLEAQEEVITGFVADGCAVNTRLFNGQPSIAGVFNGAADTFDPARHRVRFNLNPGLAIAEAVGKIKTRKVQVAEVQPVITEVRNVLTGEVNGVLNPGAIVQILGSRLKYIAEEPTNGVFLVPVDGGDEVRLSQVAENKPARITGLVPADIAAGDYTLELRTNYVSKSTTGKTLKTGRFAKTLTIA